MCRNRAFLGLHVTLWPDRPVGPDVDFRDVSKQSGLDQGCGLAEVARSSSLVSHLGLDAMFLGQFTQHPGFLDRVRQRLLCETVLARLDRQ